MVVSASWWASAARQLRLVVAALVVLVAVDWTAADPPPRAFYVELEAVFS